MALAADTPRIYELGTINELPVKASTKIYEGAAVGDDAAGYMRGLVAGDPFRGFAERQADNSATATDGYINVRVITEGKAELTITGIAITDVGKAVYASADGTFTLTEGANSHIGYVFRYVSSNTAIVCFYNLSYIAATVSTTASTNLSASTSRATSLSTIASTNLSVGNSKAVSLSTLTSTADSKGDSNAVTESTNLSVGNSKAVSLSTLTSRADSKAVSNSVIESTNYSVGNSKDTSQSVILSNHESRLASHAL